VAFGELNLLGPANRVVQALTYLRDHPTTASTSWST
jgi:NADH-quinone oxidoreductase subunit C